MLSFGEPINVTEFVKRNETENEAVIMNNLRDVLSERMSKLITFLPDDEDYDAIWEIVKIKAHRLPSSLAKRRDNNNKVVENVVRFRDKEPEKAKKIFEKYSILRQNVKLLIYRYIQCQGNCLCSVCC